MNEWRIDDLAREAGTTVRNVRVYQDRGLLEPPERRGRVGIYSDDHLDRLRLILRLLDRGYPMTAIGELLAAWKGRSGLAVILGVDDALHRAFVDETPERFRRRDLVGLFGDASWLDRAIESGILRKDGRDFVCLAPRLLRAGAQLVEDGVPSDAAWDVGLEIWRKSLELAQLMARTFVDYVWKPFKEAGVPDEGWPKVLRSLEDGREAALAGVLSAFGAALRQTTDSTLAEIGEPLELPRYGHLAK